MLSGPENMPKFGDGQLTPDEKAAIIAFIQNNKATIDPGGLRRWAASARHRKA